MTRVLNVKKAIRRRNRLQERYSQRFYYRGDDSEEDEYYNENHDYDDDDDNEDGGDCLVSHHPLRIIGLMLIIYNTGILIKNVRFEVNLQDEIESLVPLLPQFPSISGGRSLRAIETISNQETQSNVDSVPNTTPDEMQPGAGSNDQVSKNVQKEEGGEGNDEEPDDDKVLEWKHPKTSPPWTIFHHIYLAPRDQKENHENGLNIVREQIQQVADSYAGTFNDQGPKNATNATTTTIYYTSIGGRLKRDWMKQLCQEHGLDCQNLGHYNEGHEMLTLDRLQDFCVHHPQQNVAYLHTKGSFHSDMGGHGEEGQTHQRLWRYHMTAAATSEECLTALSSPSASSASPISNHDSNATESNATESNSTDGNQTGTSFVPPLPPLSCNACGLLFSPLPLPHFTGNSFAAQCKYVQKLLPSSELQVKRAILMENLKQDGLYAKFLPAVPNNVGIGRYLGEQWIGSSPEMVPCDVSQEVSIAYWMGEQRNTTTEFDLKLAPRFPMSHSDWAWRASIEDGEILEKPYRRMRDFFLLPGHLHRWALEYNAVPAFEGREKSWVWDWFVDGQRWLKRVEKDGTEAVKSFIQSQK